MDKSSEQPKKCYCARCFQPIDAEDKVDVEGQNFHRQCCMCCVCRTIPTSLKMFYGHVFCNDCFKTYVMSRFKGDMPPQMNNWWMQWGPNMAPETPEEKADDKEKEKEKEPEKKTEKAECKAPNEEHHPKKCICSRCLQAVEESEKIDIGGQSFHKHCAKCCMCHCIPKDNVKIYYGQVFCEECFHRHVLNRSKDNPTEFFKNYFEQWHNPQFADQMKDFMSGGNNAPCPFIFMMQGPQPPFCKCGNCPQPDWFKNEARKSASPDLLECGSGASELDSSTESANQETYEAAAEKIAKLTKYLHLNPDLEKQVKKWKNYSEFDNQPLTNWVDLQDEKIVTKVNCPKCLWQCGPIFVNSALFSKM